MTAGVAAAALAGRSRSGSPSPFPSSGLTPTASSPPSSNPLRRGAAPSSRAAQRVRHGFIVAQIALGFVLLAGTGLLGLSLRHALATPPGFRAEHVLTGQIDLPWKNYPNENKRLAFVERLLAELRVLPGVTPSASSPGSLHRGQLRQRDNHRGGGS